MSFSPQVWGQIRGLTADELVRALERDGWRRAETSGANLIYRHPDGRTVSVHYHPGKTYGPRLLRSLLIDIGWSEADLHRLKLVK